MVFLFNFFKKTIQIGHHTLTNINQQLGNGLSIFFFNFLFNIDDTLNIGKTKRSKEKQILKVQFHTKF